MQFPVNGVEMKLPPIKMTGSKMILLVSVQQIYPEMKTVVRIDSKSNKSRVRADSKSNKSDTVSK